MKKLRNCHPMYISASPPVYGNTQTHRESQPVAQRCFEALRPDYIGLHFGGPW